MCSCTAGLSSAIYTAAVHHHRLPLEIICTLRNLSERPRSKIIFQSSYRYRLLLSCCTDSSMASWLVTCRLLRRTATVYIQHRRQSISVDIVPYTSLIKLLDHEPPLPLPLPRSTQPPMTTIDTTYLFFFFFSSCRVHQAINIHPSRQQPFLSIRPPPPPPPLCMSCCGFDATGCCAE